MGSGGAVGVFIAANRAGRIVWLDGFDGVQLARGLHFDEWHHTW